MSVTPRELQLIEASRHLSGARVVVVGSGAAFAVAPLARLTCAPAAKFVIDSGVVDARLTGALVSVADPAMPSALRTGSMSSVFLDLLAAGRVDVSLMSAAQIDEVGNLNSTYLGPKEAPTKRFPGAGGATAMMAGSSKVVVVVRHELRRFPRVIDYVTSAGPGRSGPRLKELAVVTDLAVMRCTANEPRLRVERLMPGVSLDAVQRATGLPIDVPPDVVLAPSRATLALLRDVVDPNGAYRHFS